MEAYDRLLSHTSLVFEVWDVTDDKPVAEANDLKGAELAVKTLLGEDHAHLRIFSPAGGWLEDADNVSGPITWTSNDTIRRYDGRGV